MTLPVFEYGHLVIWSSSHPVIQSYSHTVIQSSSRPVIHILKLIFKGLISSKTHLEYERYKTQHSFWKPPYDAQSLEKFLKLEYNDYLMFCATFRYLPQAFVMWQLCLASLFLKAELRALANAVAFNYSFHLHGLIQPPDNQQGKGWRLSSSSCPLDGHTACGSRGHDTIILGYSD